MAKPTTTMEEYPHSATCDLHDELESLRRAYCAIQATIKATMWESSQLLEPVLAVRTIERLLAGVNGQFCKLLLETKIVDQ